MQFCISVCVCMCTALAPLTDKMDPKYMIAKVLYIGQLNSHKKSPQKTLKNEDELPLGLSGRDLDLQTTISESVTVEFVTCSSSTLTRAWLSLGALKDRWPGWTS